MRVLIVEDEVRVARNIAQALREQASFAVDVSHDGEDGRQLVSDASHELRTPLASAKSTLQVARMSPRSQQQYETAIDETLDDLGRMQRLVEELLLLARLDESGTAVDQCDVDLEALLRQIGQRVCGGVGAAEGRLAYDLLPATVRGEPALLERLFSNLLENAFKHGPHAGQVRVSMRTGPGGAVIVEVHDQGGAIPPVALPHLFDRFYRVDASRTKATGGAGLGLSIAHQIVLRHGGSIDISSKLESDTTVSVRLQGHPVVLK